MKRCQACTMLAVGMFLISAAPNNLEGSRDYGRGTTRRVIRWEGAADNQTIRGLYLIDITQNGMVSRVLAEDPAGRLLRITQTLDARQGREETEFFDEATGWSAGLTLLTGVKATNLFEYFQASRKVLVPEQEPLVRLVLSTQNDLRFEADLQMMEPEPEKLYEAFVTEVAASDFDEWLRREVPEGVPTSLDFLKASMSPNLAAIDGRNFAYNLRAIVEILASLCGNERNVTGSAALPMVMTAGEMVKGAGPLVGEEREFVSRFRSVSTTDPLADSRADLVFDSTPRP